MLVRTGMILLACLVAMEVVGAGEAGDALLEQMRRPLTPEVVTQVAGKDPAADAAAEHLLADLPALAALSNLMAKEASRIAERDKEQADLFADWLVDLAGEAWKGNKKDVHACGALAGAWLGKARIGVALDKPVDPRTWGKAAEMHVDHARHAGDEDVLGRAYETALGLLHEGARVEGASVQRLYDHASVLGPKGIEELPKDEPLRRAVGESFQKQAYAMHGVSNRRMQKALRGYFDAFLPLVDVDSPDRTDARHFNELVTLGRSEDLNLKQDYISRHGTALRGLIAYDVPLSGRWSVRGDEIEQRFDVDTVFRSLSFDVFDWSGHYGNGDVRDVKGDNVKGVAGLSYDVKLASFGKIRKKRKPTRGRLTKQLPSGILYEIEGETKSGLDCRMRAFYVKAVKAEKTVRVFLLESANLTEEDYELEAILDSIDITKKKR